MYAPFKQKSRLSATQKIMKKMKKLKIIRNMAGKFITAVISTSMPMCALAAPVSASQMTGDIRYAEISCYDADIRESIIRRRSDLSLIDTNKNGRIDSGEVNLSKVRYLFSYASTNYPWDKDDPVKLKIRNSNGTYTTTNDPLAQACLFSNNKRTAYNFASTASNEKAPYNRNPYIFVAGPRTSIQNLVYGKYRIERDNTRGLPSYIIPRNSSGVTLNPPETPKYSRSSGAGFIPGYSRIVKTEYRKYGRSSVRFLDTFTYLTVKAVGLNTRKPVRGAVMKLKDAKTLKTVAQWTEKGTGSYTIEGVEPDKDYVLSATDGTGSGKAYSDAVYFHMEKSDHQTVSFKIREASREAKINFSKYPRIRRY